MNKYRVFYKEGDDIKEVIVKSYTASDAKRFVEEKVTETGYVVKVKKINGLMARVIKEDYKVD